MGQTADKGGLDSGKGCVFCFNFCRSDAASCSEGDVPFLIPGSFFLFYFSFLILSFFLSFFLFCLRKFG